MQPGYLVLVKQIAPKNILLLMRFQWLGRRRETPVSESFLFVLSLL